MMRVHPIITIVLVASILAHSWIVLRTAFEINIFHWAPKVWIITCKTAAVGNTTVGVANDK